MRKHFAQKAEPQTPSEQPAGNSATQKLIAARCGVSQMTVSRVLRGDASISEETASSILTVAREMGYDPMAHDAARRLVLRRSGRKVANYLVAVVLPQEGLQEAYYTFMVEGVWQTLTNAGYSVLLVHIPEEGAAAGFEMPICFRRGDVDGMLILCNDEPLAAFLNDLHHLNTPMPQQVFLIRGPLDATMVQTDDRHGAYAATHHLLELGHRDILQLVPPGYQPMDGDMFDSRLQGVQRAYQEFDLDYRKFLHLMAYPAGWTTPMNRTVMDNQQTTKMAIRSYKQTFRFVQYLKDNPQITAIMGVNDATAQHAWYALARAGYILPLEFSVVGFADTEPLLDAEGNNMLTTVRLPLVDVGRSAAMRLVHLLTDSQEEQTLTVLQAELIVRGSTTMPFMR